MSEPTRTTPLPERHPLRISAVLACAAAAIQRRGHHKGAFARHSIDPAGVQLPLTDAEVGTAPVCMVGAIRAAVTGHPESDHPAARAAVEFLSLQLPTLPPTSVETGEDDHAEHIAEWNDQPGRTAVEAVVLLEQAALAAAGLAAAA